MSARNTLRPARWTADGAQECGAGQPVNSEVAVFTVWYSP
jgi:hypothetical protein